MLFTFAQDTLVYFYLARPLVGTASDIPSCHRTLSIETYNRLDPSHVQLAVVQRNVRANSSSVLIYNQLYKKIFTVDRLEIIYTYISGYPRCVLPAIFPDGAALYRCVIVRRSGSSALRMAFELLPGGAVRHDRLGVRLPAQCACCSRGHDVRALSTPQYDGEWPHTMH